jgi:hypothetical protein
MPEAPPAGLSPDLQDEEPENEPLAASADGATPDADEEGEDQRPHEIEGPVHRPLIRATLPRLEGQVPPARPGPDFTIRQPAGPGRPNRFRPRHPRAGQPFFGHGANGNGPMRTGSRQPAGRAPQMPRPPKRRGSGRKRSK